MRPILVTLVFSFLAACDAALPINDRACPCTNGWICCSTDNICVDQATACPGATPTQGGLTLLAGALGGPGMVDGAGGEARVLDPRAGVVRGDRLYFIDGNTIRRLDLLAGVVTTVAGARDLFADALLHVDGVGAAARFVNPRGLIDGPDGKLYVTDRETVRVVDPETGAVSTPFVLPDSNAELVLGPIAYVPGPSGDALVVADSVRHDLLRIQLGSGEITVLAGAAGEQGAIDGPGPLARFGEITGLVFLQPSLLVTERTSGAVRAVDPTTGEVSTVLGVLGQLGEVEGEGSAARLGVISAFNRGGDGYPQLVHRVGANQRLVHLKYRVDSTGDFGSLSAHLDPAITEDTVLLGVETGQALEPIQRGIVARAGVIGRAYDGQYIDAIVGTPAASDNVDAVGTSARLFSPHALVAEGDDLYFFDNASLRRLHLPTAEVTTLAGRAGVPGVVDARGPDARLPDYVNGLVSDGAGHLIFIGGDWNSVRMLDLATLEVSTLAGAHEHEIEEDIDGIGEAARFSSPTALAADGQGALYVETVFATRRIDLLTREVTTVDRHEPHQHEGTLYPILALAVDGGSLIRGWSDGVLTRFMLAEQRDTLLAGHECSVSAVPRDDLAEQACIGVITGLIEDGHGGFLFTATDEHTIRRVDGQTGAVSTVVGSPERFAVRLGALPAGLNRPGGLALLPGARLRVVLSDTREPALMLAELP